MRITRLEIFGFKSFVERFVLNLDHSIVGIVGPNGCGKSNIVDALRWVLGETHARQLRGTVLEDLIFNGSDSRRPLGMAEVSITIKPAENWAAAAMERLTEFSSTIAEAAVEQPSSEEAGGEALAAAIEGEQSEGASDLNGGGSDTSKSATAQIFSFKDTAAALEDIPGLFQAAEIQLTRRLYRSGESEYFINKTACRLADMVEFYRLIGLGARGLSIVQQGQIGQIISKKPVERRELLEEAAGIAGFRARIDAARRRLERTSQNLDRLADIIIEVEKQTRVLKRQARRAEQRSALKESLSEAETGLFKLRISKLAKDYRELSESFSEGELLGEELQNDENASAEEQEQLRCRVIDLDDVVKELRDKRNYLSAELEKGRERFRQLSLALTKAESAKASVEERISLLQKRSAEIEAETVQTRERSEELRQELASLSEDKAGLEQDLEQVRRETALSGAEAESLSAEAMELQALEDQIRKLPELNAEINTTRSRLDEDRRSYQKMVSEVHQTELLIAKKESEQASIDSHLKSIAEEVNRLADGSEAQSECLSETSGSVLIAGIEVEPELQAAVTAVLGERARYLVCDEAAELAKRYQSSRESNPDGERRAFGVIDAFASSSRGVELSDDERRAAPSASVLIEQIGVHGRVSGPLNTLMGNVVLVDTLDEGIALQAVRNGCGEQAELVVATRSGEVVTPWGWYIFDGKGVELGFVRRQEELKGEVSELAEELSLQVDRVETQQLEISNEERMLGDLEEEKAKCLACQDSLNEMLARLREEERRTREENLRREREAQEKVLQISQKKTAVEVSLNGEEKREQLLLSELNAVHEQQESAAQQLHLLGDEHNRAQAEIQSFQEAGSSDSEGEDLESRYREVQKALDEKELERAEYNRQLTILGRKLEELRKKRERFSDDRREIQLGLEKIDVERRLSLENIRGNYPEIDLPDDDECAALLNEVGEELKERLAEFADEAGKLRRRLEREGEVDPDSVEQYKTESRRLEEMLEQQSDLQAARATLERTIKNLQDISRKRFLDTFDSVQSKFIELIPRLFGGGAGHLELVNPEDPLSGGVELTVRPPGKKLKTIELLSGGEKALAATALLFAMFLHRPSPICVLDEVDAPLDDANLERFLGLVRSISAGTQFLLITHNKLSMAAADRLVGITMQESGVTKALSVSFEEAEESLEKWAANA